MCSPYSKSISSYTNVVNIHGLLGLEILAKQALFPEIHGSLKRAHVGQFSLDL